MQQKNNMDKFIIALAGNKSDTDTKDWQITDEMVSNLKANLPDGDKSIQHNTSAKTGEGVQDLFLNIA
jgi:GTPase SAR1 family protein